MKLVVPIMKYEKEIKAFRNEFIKNGDSIDGCGSLRKMDNIEDWIRQTVECSKIETCPKQYVPCTQFIYIREEDNKVIGVIQVRHYFNEFLEKYAGNIGYSVCHSERKKGYATQMLREVLPYCKELGMDKVLITCLVQNEGSRKVILHNGGVYESTVHEPNGNVDLERYWILL